LKKGWGSGVGNLPPEKFTFEITKENKPEKFQE
jgi:hypothetical protein